MPIFAHRIPKLMRKFLMAIYILVAANTAYAQDPHFSQFFSSPLTLNPAFTGKFDGQFRFAANYRSQWQSIPNAYSTASGSVDFGILKNSIGKGDIFGLGISGVTDQSGDGALKLNYGSFSIAYHKSLDEDGFNTLGVGFQGTVSSLNVNTSKLTFGDQLMQNGFTGSTSETFSNGTSVSYLDMNAGVLYSGSSNGNNNYYVGLSFYHINNPSVGFLDKNWKLSPRITAHGGGTFPLGETLSLSASIIEELQNQANETVAGGALCVNLNGDDLNPTNIYFGSWYRLGDAVIPYVGLEFSGLRLGASYDINMSSLKAATEEKGGAEFSIIYITKNPEGATGIPCPKF
jgi:type IX secretion system PorP/SprF family membrane protein